MAKGLPKLAASGAVLYPPPPGAIIQNGQFLANVGYAGLAVEYSVDQGATWQAYQGSVAVSVKSVQVRSRVRSHYSRVTKAE